jgi:hypothetical protein
MANPMRFSRGKVSGVRPAQIRGEFPRPIGRIPGPAGPAQAGFSGDFFRGARARKIFPSGQSFAISGKTKRPKKLTHFSQQTC